MAFIEYHREADHIEVSFSEQLTSLLGFSEFKGSFNDFKKLTKVITKRAPDEVGDPIILNLFEPPESEADEDDIA